MCSQTDLALGNGTSVTRPVRPPSAGVWWLFQFAICEVGGLHHTYDRVAENRSGLSALLRQDFFVDARCSCDALDGGRPASPRGTQLRIGKGATRSRGF